MSEKSINYMSRDYNSIKNELINLTKQYYPELTDSFNDGSVGSWMIDLISSVGDELNYYIDRSYNEQNINSAALKSSVLNFARMNNVKVPGPKAATCEVEVSVTIPGTGGNDGNMAIPNWDYAPKIPQGATVGNGTVTFEIMEDINFKEQFNRDAVSNRRWVPVRNSQGNVTGYTVTKSVLATSGRSRIYKKVITANELEPFMEFVLPFQNVMNIEGIIFKETSDMSINPELFEFYVNAEKFRVYGETVTTYKFFEVDSLTDQYIFGEEAETPGTIQQFKDPHAYVEYDANYKLCTSYTEVLDKKNYNPTAGSKGYEYTDCNGNKKTVTTLPDPPFVRYYQGSWMPVMQKFITEYTDNGYIKIIFGSGTNRIEFEDGDPNSGSAYAKNRMSKMVNNDLTGILPKAGWTMYILYRDGGGSIANVGRNALTQLGNVTWVFNKPAGEDDTEWSTNKNNIIRSATATNVTQCLAGSDAPSVDEIKYLTKYSNSAQNRCVTLKDYEFKIKSMPAKYGAPYRCKAIEENNKVLLYTLGLTSEGKLTEELADVVTENMVNYLSRFKSLGDLIEIRNGNIYNIQVEPSIYVNKSYNIQEVVKKVIQTIYDYFDINNHVMGENMFIGDLEKEISALDGVANLISLKIYSIWGSYKERDLGRKAVVPIFDNGEAINRKEINLASTNKILSCDAQGMYEIKEKDLDILVRVSTI